VREKETEEVETIFRLYGLEGQVLQHMANAIASDRQRWIDLMMRFELGLERPDPKRAPCERRTAAEAGT
jgi:hypothetical protein